MTAEKRLVLNQIRLVLNSDAQISLGEIAERALEDPESRVLLEKLLIRLSQADSRFPEN